ncbi:MAG: hypothetical protein RLZZ499_1172, partial [Cyanobacteriota bacterium]
MSIFLQKNFKFNYYPFKSSGINRWLIGLLTFGLVIGLAILPVWTQQPIAITTLVRADEALKLQP